LGGVEQFEFALCQGTTLVVPKTLQMKTGL
jgi:hypothetical protein